MATLHHDMRRVSKTITAIRKAVYAKSAGRRNVATSALFGATARPNVRWGGP
jgi:hypothetical protein